MMITKKYNQLKRISKAKATSINDLDFTDDIAFLEGKRNGIQKIVGKAPKKQLYFEKTFKIC